MTEKWWNTVEPLVFDIEAIDYRKYLNCHDCKKVGLYCKKHRMEVELQVKSIIK